MNPVPSVHYGDCEAQNQDGFGVLTSGKKREGGSELSEDVRVFIRDTGATPLPGKKRTARKLVARERF